ncbi:gliding motility-associated C-terminal domain-containing protein, partial [Lutibacter holmesii]
TNTVSNSQDQTDLTDVDASASVTVSSADLVTTKVVDNATPNEGDTVTYTITVLNNGPSAATGVSLTDNLPIGVTYASHSTLEGNYNSGSGIWNIGTVANGATATLEIVATVDVGTSGSTITNITTAATGDQSDLVTGTDTLEAPLTVGETLDIVLTKVVDNATPNEGDIVTYTVTVENQGPATATNLIVTDVLASGLSFGIATPSVGTFDTATGIWTVGTLASGITETLTIQALVGVGTSGQVLTNTVSNSQDQTDLTDVDASASVTVSASDLVTTKVVDNATPNEGDTVTYTITVLNNGPSVATGVSLTDNLPIGVTYASHNTSKGNFNRGSGIWNIGEIAVGETVELQISAIVNSNTGGTIITNYTTAASGDQVDLITSGDILFAAIQVINMSDVVLTKVVDNATPNEGDIVTYTVTVTNNGTAEVTNLVVSDNLPIGLSYGAVTPTVGTWLAPNWTIGTLDSGVTETITIEAVVGPGTKGQVLTNTVSNTQDQIDSNVTPDDDTESITVTSLDLMTVKTVDNSTPNEGDIITYTIEVTNILGGSDATGVKIIDVLPIGVSYVSHTTNEGAFNWGSGLWSIGDLPNGDTAVLLINASVDSGTLGTTITNTTSDVIADQGDSDSSNNKGSVAINPTAFIDLSLTKDFVDGISEPTIGNLKTFEIRVLNEGPSNATGVEVTDVLPSGYDFLSYSSTIGTYDQTSGIWEITQIEPGNTAVLLIDVLVLTTGDHLNCAEITAANEIDVDSTPGNGDSSEDDIDCEFFFIGGGVNPSGLIIEKTVVADNLEPLVNSEISFEIKIENTGKLDQSNIVVSDILPAGFTFLNYSSSRGDYDEISGDWNVGKVLRGEVEILIIDVLVNATGPYENCATINLNGETSCVEVTPIAVIDLELTKDVDIFEPTAGSNVDFTVSVTNEGPSNATGVEVTDVLPSGYVFESAIATVGIYNEATGVWYVGDVQNGETQSLVITAKVVGYGDWLNIAEVTDANEFDIDSTPGNGDIREDDMDSVYTMPIVDFIIPNEFTPNGDGINDVFEVGGIEILYPNFKMEIVNRWGNKVYEYQHNGDPGTTPMWWDGYSDGRWNVGAGELPIGTYFYTIYYNDNERVPQTGWVYLKR